MRKSIIYKKNLKPFLHQVWQNRPVWKFYAQMRNHLKAQLNPEIAALFAEPVISKTAEQGLSEASWLSDQVSRQARPLSSLSGEEFQRYEKLLAAYVQQLSNHINTLRQGDQKTEQEWAELLEKALEIPSYDYVLFENDRLVLVLWGFKDIEQAQSFKLTQKLSGLATLAPVLPEEKIIPEEEEEAELPLEEELPLEKEPIVTLEEPEAFPTPKEEPVSEEEERKEEALQEPFQATTSPPVQKPPFGKRWWWLLLILGLLLLFLLLRNCTGTAQLLPEKPNVLVPIDSTEIGYDKDSVQQIASGRLNVVIGDSSKTEMDFAKAFKKLYPPKSYQVIYYDSTTKRLQIKMPPEERSAVEETLKKELSDFDLLIWEESIFKSKGVPSDPAFGSSTKAWHPQRINAYSAWDISTGAKKIKVAVIDDGFDLKHPELSANVENPRNIPSPGNPVASGVTGHGTHVAGIAIGGMDNGQGLAGIAPNCQFIPIQVGDARGRMSTTAIIDAVLYALQQDVDVINMSLGKMMHPQVALLSEAEQERMVQYLFKDEEAFWNRLFGMANKKGVTVVLAGGNQNIIIGLDPMQRTPYTINVSATDPNDRKASFSNYGRRSTISAPGVQIYSALPNRSFGPLDGTSMAAPIVTGAVALIKSVNPALTNQEIIDILQSTGIPLRQPIGNLLQLDVALDFVKKGRQRLPRVDCPEAQERIDELLQEIERIREECEENNLGDTLKIPKGDDDLGLLEGRWKSTTPIVNVRNGKKLEVYFDFYNNGTGKINLIEPDNTNCSADLALKLNAGNLEINQMNAAVCVPPPDTYQPYIFECRPDKNDCAECVARNKLNRSNQFSFKLVKVNTVR